MRPLRLIPLAVAAASLALLLLWALRDRPVPGPSATLEADDAQAFDGEARATLRAERPSPRPAGDAGPLARPGAGASTQAQAPLTGRVVDETDRGIPGARVVVRALDPQALRGAPHPDGAVLAAGLTDAKGAFALEAPTGMWLRVVASAAGRATVGRRVPSAGARLLLVLPPAGALHVEVLDHAARHAVGVAVEAIVAETRLETVTDAEGVARLDTLPPGPARLRAGGGAWPAIVAGPFAVRAGVVQNTLLVLPRAVRIAGVVLDDRSGTPVAGAEVHVAHPGRSHAAPPTDAQGRFGPLPGGGAGERILLAVQADGYAPLREPWVLRAEDLQTVTLRLVPGTAWSGRVLHADGRPAVGAEVGYTPDGIADLAPAATRADEEGRFELPPPPRPAPGRRVVLTARLDGALAARALRPDSARPESLVLTLAPGSNVRGTVRDATGAGLPGVAVRLTPSWDEVPRGANPDEGAARLLATNEWGFQGLAAASGADGSWHVPAVPAGPYRVYFDRDGALAVRPETLRVRGSDVDAGVQTLGSGLTLEGRIRDVDGTPLAGVSVRVAPVGQAAAARGATTDLDGVFRIDGVTGGRHLLTATWPGRDPLRGEVEVDERQGARVELSFEDGAVLRGRVLHDGAPWSGVLTVALQTETGREDPRATRHVRVRAGTFELAGVAAGTRTVQAFGPSGLRARAGPVETTAGRTTEITLQLQAAARLRGTVRDSSGAAVVGATVALRATETGRRLLATADTNGRWHFDALLPGDYALEARGRGGAPVEDAVDLAAGEVREHDLVLLPAGRLAIRVVDERGRAVAGALILARNEGGTLRSRTPVRTDSEGAAEYPDLPPGPVQLRARSPDGREGTARAAVAAGAEPRQVVIRVGPGGPR